MPRFVAAFWNTPRELLDRLNRELQELVQSPEWAERIPETLGITPVSSTREIARNDMASEFRTYKANADRAGVAPQ